MIKGLSIIFIIALVLIGTALAMPSLNFDFNGDLYWDREWTLDSSVGETVKVDLWLDGWDTAPYSDEDLFGAKIFFYYDNTQIRVNQGIPNDSNNGGPFDAAFSVFSKLGGGGYQLEVANFSCVPIKDKFKLYTLELECIAAGDSTISIKANYPTGGISSGGIDCLKPHTGDADDGSGTIHQIGDSDDEDDEDEGDEDEGDEGEGDEDEGEKDGESFLTTTIIPITTSVIIRSDANQRKAIPDIAMTTTPKATLPAAPDTTRMTVPKTTFMPGTLNSATTIKNPTGQAIESSEGITQISTKTTAIPLSSPYQVLISPSPVELSSSGVLRLVAKTLSQGTEVGGKYSWNIVPASTIGSTIDENGQFTAGSNASTYKIKETIRVTDTLHENSETTAIVTINIKQPSSTGCELSIGPSSATLFPGDAITFSVKNLGKRCVEGSYKWKILSKIDSHISRKGLYTAGNNESGDSTFDIVIVEDTTNNSKADAIVTVVSKGTGVQVAPNATYKPQQEALFGTGIYSRVLIVIVLIILTGIVVFWKIKRQRYPI